MLDSQTKELKGVWTTGIRGAMYQRFCYSEETKSLHEFGGRWSGRLFRYLRIRCTNNLMEVSQLELWGMIGSPDNIEEKLEAIIDKGCKTYNSNYILSRIRVYDYRRYLTSLPQEVPIAQSCKKMAKRPFTKIRYP